VSSGCILLEEGSELLLEDSSGCISLEATGIIYPASYPAWWWVADLVHVSPGVAYPWGNLVILAANQPAWWSATSRLKTGIASPWQALGSTKSGTPNPFEARKSQIRIGRTV
jgi:hypothetical protein